MKNLVKYVAYTNKIVIAMIICRICIVNDARRMCVCVVTVHPLAQKWHFDVRNSNKTFRTTEPVTLELTICVNYHSTFIKHNCQTNSFQTTKVKHSTTHKHVHASALSIRTIVPAVKYLVLFCLLLLNADGEISEK